jgi:DNA-binding CsgD family transcriptional regulator
LSTSAPSASDPPGELLERSRHFSVLGESLAAVLSSARGSLVLVAGEAGGGKTALLRQFCDEHRSSVRVLEGACDALFTPRPLGPLLDVAQAAGGELEELVEGGGSPHEIAAALIRELAGRVPTILVLEDLHWADEATLDVLTLLARRVETVPTLVLASYRDELDHAHPLRLVLGHLSSTAAVSRLKIEPLSPEAVGKLAAPHGVDADQLYGKTAGNPFFVTEVLASEKEEIPPTIRDAVLVRAARLSPSAAALVEAVAVAPPQVELWLLTALAGEVIDGLDEGLMSGMLTHDRDGIAFRHELARLAVEESLPANRRLSLHLKALAALADPPAGGPDLERLAHHADAAGDGPAVLRFAPAAAARAAALGAHREAAAQYARAIRFADSLEPEDRAELLELRSHQCYLTDQLDEAIAALKSAIECYRELGDPRKEGDSLRRLADVLWFPGRTADAAEAAHEALAVLEQLPPGRELVMAYTTIAILRSTLDDSDGALLWGTRASELAQQLDDSDSLISALITIGVTELFTGVPSGLDKLERSLELAERTGVPELIGRALINLVWAGTRLRRYELADRYLGRGLAYLGAHGLDLWHLFLLASRARIELDRGRWSEAADSVELVFRKRSVSTFPRNVALVVLGLVRARRGDPDSQSPLDEALALAEPTGELPRIAPVAAARAEAAWLAGDREAVNGATADALELALRRGAAWPIGELAYWRWRAGLDSQVPSGIAAEPYAVQITGDWRRAAELWTEIGCPYEAALAHADADDEDTLRQAFDELQRLGARPAATIVARRLRERGVRGVPRGPRAASRANPANLTPREVDVLALVAEGLHNAEIAERLYLAEKTVDHYVSAILRKLDVRTRAQASAEAVRLGLAGQDR